MQILREAADQQIIKPLRTHGWDARVASEATDGEFLVLAASKASAEHKIALMYSSATANHHYKSLDRVVEHIFTNGALYHIESYAYGISAPVTPIDEFFPLLLKWNKEIAPAIDAPARRTPVKQKERPTKHITAESPLESIWAQLDQFASRQLAEKLVKRRACEASMTLSQEAIESKAAGVAYSIRNASDYLRGVAHESLNRRITSLYYGVLALAFAELLASPAGPTDLDEVEGMTKQGHGLYTVPSVSGDFGGVNVGVLATGFFARWASFLGYDTTKFPKAKPKTPSDVEKLAPRTVATIRSLLAAIPELGDLYLEVFDASPSWVVPVYMSDENPQPVLWGRSGGQKNRPESTYVRFVDPSKRIGLDLFQNADWPVAEITLVSDDEDGRSFRARVDHAGCDYWHEALPIHRSPFDSRMTLIVPVLAGVSEYRAVATSVLYALSIMVRYMPSAWRRVEGGDWDQHLAMIKTTVRVFERVLPEEFLASITGEHVHASQPGSLF